jgi:hypothetical protein
MIVCGREHAGLRRLARGSVGRKTSALRTCFTLLNTSPAHSPVKASRLPSRTARASLEAGVVRHTFTVRDFRLYLQPLSRRTRFDSASNAKTRCGGRTGR